MRAEAMEAAESALGKCADMARALAGVEPEQVIREGNRAEEIVKLIEEDEDIAVLVLAAGDRQGRPRSAGHGARRQGSRAPSRCRSPSSPAHLDDEAIAAIA